MSQKQNEYLSQLDKIPDKNKLQHDLAELKSKQIDLSHRIAIANGTISSQASSLSDEVNTVLSDFEKLQKTWVDLSATIDSKMTKSSQLDSSLTDQMNEISNIKQYDYYLRWVLKTSKLSKNIESHIHSGSIQMAVNEFVELSEVAKELDDTHCFNLSRYLNDMKAFWFKTLREFITNEIADQFTVLPWPVQVIKGSSSAQKSTEAALKLEQCFRQFKSLMSVDSIDSQPLSPYMKLLLKPFAKRFRYHFYGQKQTNLLEKPEFFFTQIITWIRSHSDCMLNIFQDIFNRLELDINTMDQFACGLSILAVEKSNTELPTLINDDQLFLHFIDEALAFHYELRKVVDHLPLDSSILSCLSTDEVFNKWIVLEQKNSVERMETILSSTDAWSCLNLGEESFKTPDCTQNFLLMLETLTDRYSCLESKEKRQLFFSLQLELLDEFRIRLLQLMREECKETLGGNFCPILNTTRYIGYVLEQWSGIHPFIELLSFSGSSSAKIGQNSFHDISDLFEHMKMDMLKILLHHLSDSIRIQLKSFKRSDHFPQSTDPDDTPLYASPFILEIVSTIREHLHFAEEKLSSQPFQLFWQMLAERLDEILFHDVILVSHFDDTKINQLKCDLRQNVFVVFGNYTQKPHKYFDLCCDAMLILELKLGSAMLFKETIFENLHESGDSEKTTSALRELGASKITPKNAEMLLALRNDLVQ